MSTKAAEHFQGLFDAMPDRTEPPTDGPFYRGDLCKVNGKAMIWMGDGWRDPEPISRETYIVELPDAILNEKPEKE
jgi:hypothetical protein